MERALAPPGARASASNLAGSSKSLLVAALADRRRRGRAAWGTLLVVTPTTERADSLAEDLQAFSGAGAALVFPSWEVLPYEEREPHPDIVGANGNPEGVRFEEIGPVSLKGVARPVTVYRALREAT